jgi:ADP-heptose:LPS heptosyltransferase
VKLVTRDLAKLGLFVFGTWGGFSKTLTQFKHAGRKHLVILRPDGIGDFVVFARNFHHIRDIYPYNEWSCTLIGNRIWRPIAEELNRYYSGKWFDRFIAIDRSCLKRKIGYQISLAKTLKELNCVDLLYPVHSRDVWGNVMAKWIPAQNKIAPFGNNDNITATFKGLFDYCFSRLIEEKHDEKLEVEQTDHFFRILGSKIPKHQSLAFLPVTPLMVKERDICLASIGLNSNDRYVVIFPGAAWVGKRWPAERFIEWGRGQIERKLYVIVCGGFNETELGRKVAQCIGRGAFNLAGKTSLIGLSGLLAKAELCLSNDTAAIHISAAFNRPTICIMGGGHFGRFWPYGNLTRNQILSHDMPCFGCGWECRYHEIPFPCIRLIKFNHILSTHDSKKVFV